MGKFAVTRVAKKITICHTTVIYFLLSLSLLVSILFYIINITGIVISQFSTVQVKPIGVFIPALTSCKGRPTSLWSLSFTFAGVTFFIMVSQLTGVEEYVEAETSLM
jgi:hypothetical protein